MSLAIAHTLAEVLYEVSLGGAYNAALGRACASHAVIVTNARARVGRGATEARVPVRDGGAKLAPNWQFGRFGTQTNPNPTQPGLFNRVLRRASE